MLNKLLPELVNFEIIPFLFTYDFNYEIQNLSILQCLRYLREFTELIRLRSINTFLRNTITLPSNTQSAIRALQNELIKRFKQNKDDFLFDFELKFEPTRFNFSNDVCRICCVNLPLYWPSVRKYWIRSIREGFSPRALLKGCCSNRCLRRCKQIPQDSFECIYCASVSDFRKNYICNRDTISFKLRMVRIFGGNRIQLGHSYKIQEVFANDRLCSRFCKIKFEKRNEILNESDILVKTDILDSVYVELESVPLFEFFDAYDIISINDGKITPLTHI
jgi:hypothetical protein